MKEIDHAGEGGNLVEALERCRKRLNRVFASFRLSHSDAEDVLQDVALLAIRQFAEIQNLDAWLLTVAHNRCVLLTRKKRCRHEIPWEGSMEPVVPAEQEQIPLRVDLTRSLAGLPRRLSRILALRAQGFNRREIGVRIGRSGNSISQFISRDARWAASQEPPGPPVLGLFVTYKQRGKHRPLVRLNDRLYLLPIDVDKEYAP